MKRPMDIHWMGVGGGAGEAVGDVGEAPEEPADEGLFNAEKAAAEKKRRSGGQMTQEASQMAGQLVM